jgi:hypothetical protein
MSPVLQIFSELHLPHWLIIAGSALVALGVVGLLIQRIRAPTSEQYEDPESIDKEIAENLHRAELSAPKIDSERGRADDPLFKPRRHAPDFGGSKPRNGPDG